MVKVERKSRCFEKKEERFSGCEIHKFTKEETFSGPEVGRIWKLERVLGRKERTKGGKIFRVKEEMFSCEAKLLVRQKAKGGREIRAKPLKGEAL